MFLSNIRRNVVHFRRCMQQRTWNDRNIRFKSSHVAQPKQVTLGLNDITTAGDGYSRTTKLVAGYITFGIAAMIVIARAKEQDEDVEEHARVFNMAKRAVVKDRRFFEAVGYPKEFEQISKDDSTTSITNEYRGSIRVSGTNGSAIITYLYVIPTNEESNSTPTNSDFEQLEVKLEDGSSFSALEAFVQNESVERQQKATSLGKKLFFPIIGGVVIGGFCSFLLIRIVRNRPFYVHKLVLDHVNNHDVARMHLGHPIKTNRKQYVGFLNDSTANYTIPCEGPNGTGTLTVKAYKNTPVKNDTSESESSLTSVHATAGTDWKFSKLVLALHRNERKKEKGKPTKVINLLNTSTT